MRELENKKKFVEGLERQVRDAEREIPTEALKMSLLEGPKQEIAENKRDIDDLDSDVKRLTNELKLFMPPKREKQKETELNDKSRRKPQVAAKALVTKNKRNKKKKGLGL